MTQILRHRGMRITALLVVVIGITMLMLLPPSARVTPPFTGGPPTARGAYHIHSDRSDGSGSLDDIAQAAQRAGLQFVIVTDHGDGTRPPEAPQYRHGVLVIDAVELNTSGGHLVALGLPAAPYPFAGTAADVLEDVHRLGGFGIAAHPDSPRPALSWQAWDTPVDGLEWINGDSSWRDEGTGSLVRAVLGYGLRAPGALASLLDRPTDLLARWDALGAKRSVPVLAAADAHARLGADDPDPASVHVPLPGYESAFRAFSNHVVLAQPLSGDGVADAAAVLAALRQGRSFTVIDALATPGALVFTAESGAGGWGRMGDAIPLEGDVTLRARSSGPAGATLILLRNGTPLRETTEGELVFSAGQQAGVYRVEVHLPGAPGSPPVPWILSNPIYVGLPRLASAVSLPLDPLARIPARTADAAVEKGRADVSELVDARMADVRERRLAGQPPIGWRFALSPGTPAGQFAAVEVPVSGGLAAFDRVRFTVKAGAPIRAWVQLRAGEAAERWGRTFYADGETRIIDVPLRSFLPIGVTSSATAPLDKVGSLLFVVDTLNGKPGTSGSITLAEVAFVR